MVVRANIVKNQAISVDLNQKVGGFNAPVKSVNSKTGDVILDANDVGAISKDELQATTNEILAQAKESGVFDGPQGEKGEKGDKGDIGLTGPQGPTGSDANVTAENIDRALGYTPADRIALEELARRLNALADSDDVTLDQMSEFVAYIKANRSLIESVTTNKVNVSDIIDNLTTNVSNKPLSAAQGAVLKGLINDLENSKANQTGLDELSDWTHQAVDEIVEFVSKDSNIESAFNFVSSNTLNWNGDTTGKLISVNSKDPSMSYVRVSSVVPTLTDLQKGGTWATIDDDGVEYEEPFTSDNIVENGNLIVGVDGYFLVAKEDNVQYIEGTDINVVLPKAGTYFIYFGADGYMSRLSVTDYTGFTKSILKMESLTLHQHDWYGKAVVGGNTARGDEAVHGGFVKVSDSVPTLEEVNKGGTVRYYYVTDNKITGDLIVGNYLESPYSAFSSGNEIIIASDGVVIVKINSSGVFFKQSNDVCVHSLTINGYTKFSYNVEKIPFELIPEGIGGGVTSWNDLPDKPFGETTVTLIDNQTITLSEGRGQLEGFSLEENGVYTVIYNGTEYADLAVVTSVDTNATAHIIGNIDALSGTGDNGIPFVIGTQYGMSMVVDLAMGESCTITITQKGIKTLEDKYLPEPLQLVDIPAPKTLADNPTLDFVRDGAWASLLYSGALNMDSTYTVIYNGVEYKDLVPKLYDSSIVIQPDESDWNIMYDPNYLGVTVLYVTTPEGSEVPSVTITLIESSATKKGINIKSLPESHQFGETTVEGDTLTWDGDMTGKLVVSVDVDEGITMNFVQVSDVVPTVTELQQGGTATASEGGTVKSMPFTSEQITDGDLIALNATFIAKVDNVFFEGFGVTFPKAGIYFISAPAMETRTESFTINGFKGFKTTGIKKIDKKYIPSSSGLISKESDTLLFLGDLSFRKIWGAGEGGYDVIAIVKLSDVVPTLAELQKGGATLVLKDGGVWDETAFDSSAVSVHDAGYIQLSAGVGYIITDKPTSMSFSDGTTVPISEPGIYALTLGVTDDGIFLSDQGIRINEFTGFAKNEIDNPARIPVYTVDGVKPDATGNVNITHPEIPIVKVIYFSKTDGVLTTTEKLSDIIGLLRNKANIVLLKARRQNPSNPLQYIYYEVTYYDTRPSDREIRFERRNGDSIETIYWTENGITIS